MGKRRRPKWEERVEKEEVTDGELAFAEYLRTRQEEDRRKLIRKNPGNQTYGAGWRRDLRDIPYLDSLKGFLTVHPDIRIDAEREPKLKEEYVTLASSQKPEVKGPYSLYYTFFRKRLLPEGDS